MRCLTIAVTALFLTACATSQKLASSDTASGQESSETTVQDDVNDPIEPLNRYIFELNKFADELFLKPVAVIYRGITPDPIRTGVRNVLNNLRTPLTFIHDVAQGETERAGQSFGRFTTNTLIGVGGIFDIAAGEEGKEGIPYHEEDLGQTLAVWGVGEGPYLMLPLFGPSNARDAVGRVGDFFLDPVGWIGSSDTRQTLAIVRVVSNAIHYRSLTITTLDEIERSSIDYYATVRSLYRQRRRAEIANGSGF